MFGISFPELIVIFVIALLVFGPEKLPEIARGLGKLVAELRRNSDALRREFYNATYKPADEVRRPLGSVSRELRSIKAQLENDLAAPLDPLSTAPSAPTEPPAPPAEKDSNSGNRND